MKNNIYIYIMIMAVVTYLIRVLPLTLIKKDIENKFIKSFLYYVPYVTLSVMTFPAILHATGNVYAATAGFVVALILAWFRRSLIQVSAAACVVVFAVEMLFNYI